MIIVNKGRGFLEFTDYHVFYKISEHPSEEAYSMNERTDLIC